MKLLIILTLVSVVSTSCMEARNRSSIVGNSSDGAKYAKEYDTSPEDRVGTGLPGFTPTEGENTRMDDDDTTTTLGAPSDATGCATRDTNHLGKITVCKSKTNDLDIYIQVDTVITST
ncbi:MAG: hypothetical protein KAG61_08730, partial [Bacteriovoracaceae bacterium]|nr:hypothetical protein [Bacteriovoracaceae bacterium]